MRKGAAIALLVVFGGEAFAQDLALRDGERRAINNFQHETTVCANYFLLVQKCLTNTPGVPASTVERYEGAANDLIRTALALGQLIGMTQDAMTARMKMEGDAIMTLVNGDCVNIASANSRYSERCIEVASNGDAILGDMIAKAPRD